MKAFRLGVLCVGLLCRSAEATNHGDLPPAAREVLSQFEGETAEIEKQAEVELNKWRDKTAAALKLVQDQFCREAKLDEAVAIRGLIRNHLAGVDLRPSPDLPLAAWEIYMRHEDEVAEIQRKCDADVQKWRVKAATELMRVRATFLKEAKVEEAVAVRDLIRAIRDGVIFVGSPARNPGYVNNSPSDIGKVFYYEVTGTTTGGSLYGTDVYTTGSHLGMATVHCGVLKHGQTGTVRVSILPGQANYTASTRNGVTSHPYGSYSVSFKVERAYGFVRKAAK